jgi:hypothetical protein
MKQLFVTKPKLESDSYRATDTRIFGTPFLRMNFLMREGMSIFLRDTLTLLYYI